MWRKQPGKKHFDKMRFEGVIIATRVVKLAGNFLNYIAGKRSQVNLKSFFLIISTIATIGIMAFASFFTKGWPQIALVGLAIFAKAAVYDAFTVHMLDFMLNRLKKENMIMVLYIRNLAVGLSSVMQIEGMASTVKHSAEKRKKEKVHHFLPY